METSLITYLIFGVLGLILLTVAFFGILLIRQIVIDGIDFVLSFFGHLPISKNCSRCQISRYFWDENGKCIGRDRGY